jgi:ornithine cyclodeaminase/alanine dehydrogenase-like protein (mu-crystallin family)
LTDDIPIPISSSDLTERPRAAAARDLSHAFTAEPAWGAQAGLRFVSRDELFAALPFRDAADALAAGFAIRTPAEMEGTPRSVLSMPDRSPGDEAELLLMPAHGEEGAGLKLVSIVRGNPGRGLPLIQGLYVLLTRDGLTPELVIDGAALTALRTAAVSALATSLLARPDSRRLVVFGAGEQAAVHVAAMRTVLPIEHVTVVGRTSASQRAATLVSDLLASDIEATVGTPASVADADVICTCTTSATPVFSNADLQPGVHVNAIGAYRLDMREIPNDCLSRAVLVVESVDATLAEAGDVVAAIDSGALPAEGFARELHELLTGTIGRSSDDEVTVFKSVGLSIEDLIVARAAADAIAIAH